MSNCKKCGAEIIWARRAEKQIDGSVRIVPGSKANPIDARRFTDGNLVLDSERGIYRFATGNEQEMAEHGGKRLRKSHFAVCPGADDFRRNGKAQPL